MGPPCSSFVWMNSSACKRNAVDDSKGDVSYERVHDGNVQAEVAVFMFVYALHRHVVPVLEREPATKYAMEIEHRKYHARCIA